MTPETSTSECKPISSENSATSSKSARSILEILTNLSRSAMALTLAEEHLLNTENHFTAFQNDVAQLKGPRAEHYLARTFPELFEEQASNHASRVAVSCNGERLTYADLNRRANQLASHLRSLGAGRESIIGICIDRSLEMAVGILGILKSGAAYLPLD